MTLPDAGAAFRWTDESWGAALRCRALEPVAQHAFTTRQLRLRAPGDPTAEETAWAAAVAAVDGAVPQVCRVTQVHGAAVRVIRRDEAPSQSRPDADALVSDRPGAVLAVQVADCVPLLLADARRGVVAAVHAGWRGTAARIAPAAVASLSRAFGSRPDDLVAAIGPSIGPCCYEVGAELPGAFRQAGASDAEIRRWFPTSAAGALVLDLWAATHDQLVAAGLDPERVFACRLCTRTHVGVFASYRADGPSAGRMAALIRVPGSSESFG